MLPMPGDLRHILEELTGRPVSLTLARPLAPTQARLTTGVYTDSRLATAAVVLMDRPAAARLAACAGSFPAGVAADAIAAQHVPPLLLPPLNKVFEGLTALFPRQRLTLYALQPGGDAPTDVLAMAAAAGRRLDVTIAVRTYGVGRVSVVLAR
ncbi:MAG TPA: hypothetical protein VFJ14_12290 [Nocardioidaceae bacterium]|nr:hypothetical protein [Nocardioidaceae bacterium]